MNVQIQLNPGDYVAFAEAFYARTPGGRTVRRMNDRTTLLGFCVVAALALFIGGEDVSWLFRICVLAITGAVFGGLNMMTVRTIRRRCRRMLRATPNKAFFAPTEVSIGATGIETESEYLTSRTKWTGVENIVETEAHIFISLGVLGLFIIPKRCFLNTEEAHQFCDAACGFKKGAEETLAVDGV